MKVAYLTSNQRDQWNEFVAQEPLFGLLQSWEWGEFKEMLGWRAFRLAAKEHGRIIAGAQMLIKPLSLGLTGIAYIPRGPVGNWLDEQITPPLLSELHRVARRHKASFLRIEPSLLQNQDIDRILQQFNFQISPHTNQPRSTIIVDLAPELDQILAQMHQKTRYNIRYATKKGVVVQAGNFDDLETLHHLMQITGRRGGFIPRLLDYYRCLWETFAPLGKLKLFIATFREKKLAVNVSAILDKHAAYLHGASSDEHRNLQSNYLLMWEAMKWAKGNNCDTFDLWGIPEEVGLTVYKGNDIPVSDRTDGLWGVYRFKRGFSRSVILYTSAHDYVYNPLIYRAIKFAVNRLGSLDRITQLIDRFSQ